MACACFTRNCQSSCSVRDAPGLFCQGCARSVPRRGAPPPLGFSQVLILKVVKVLCFDTLLQVLILKVVRSGTDAVPFGASSLALAPICNLRKSARAWNPLRQEHQTPHPYNQGSCWIPGSRNAGGQVPLSAGAW